MTDNNNTVSNITKPSITRLARRAGVKSVSEESFDPIRNLIEKQIDIIVRAALIVNSEHQTKTLMPDDIYDAFSLLGINVTPSNDLNTVTCGK